VSRDRWNHRDIDSKALEKQVRMAVHYASRLQTNAKRGSILTDLDYGELHNAVESIYNIAKIGDLAQDNLRRKRAEEKAREHVN